MEILKVWTGPTENYKSDCYEKETWRVFKSGPT